MDNLTTFAILVATSQQEAYWQDRSPQPLYPEPIDGLGYMLTGLLSGLGAGLVWLGQMLQHWGQPAATSCREEVWS